MLGLFSPPWRLVPALLTVLQLFAVLAVGDNPGKGYHSSKFDQKYNALRDLLITPSTHPHLFRVCLPGMEKQPLYYLYFDHTRLTILPLIVSFLVDGQLLVLSTVQQPGLAPP